MSPVSNEYILYTLAQVATTLAGFSGLVVVFRVRGAQAWSRAELRTFWFLLGDSLIVLLMYAAFEFLFFIGLMSQQGRHLQAQGTDSRLIRE
jgi:hypothetical protein